MNHGAVVLMHKIDVLLPILVMNTHLLTIIETDALENKHKVHKHCTCGKVLQGTMCKFHGMCPHFSGYITITE